MKKKVLFVTEALWVGGIETSLINLLNHFDYDKYEVTLLVIRAELELADQINENCRLLVADREKTVSFKEPYTYVRLFHLTEEGTNPSLLHRVLEWSVPVIKAAEYRFYLKYIQKMLKDEWFDTCILYSDSCSFLIRAIPSKKYLIYYHHGKFRRKYGDSFAYKKCDWIIAVSQNQEKFLKKAFPAKKNKIVTIHNLIDIETVRKQATEPIEERFEKSNYNIVSVGRVSHEKGMDLAVRACAILVGKGYTNIRWWIVGGGPAMKDVLDTIQECRMEKYIITVGMKRNPYPYMKQADLYVQPSRFEGYPMSLLEALVLGQPVISTDNNGAREIITDEETGLLCRINEQSIAASIGQVLRSKECLEKLKENVQKIDFNRMNMYSLCQLYKIL